LTRFAIPQRNTFVFISVSIISFFALKSYFESNRYERLYATYRGIVERDLPNFQSRSSGASSVLDSFEMELSLEDYAGAIDHLEQMILENPFNSTLKYYAAVLHERNKNYLASIEYYHRVRLNSEIFHLDALKRLTLLYIKLDKSERAREMLTELSRLGSADEQVWAREIAAELD
jgi:tetratricopeptide (TPR) repeat protein